MPVTHMYLKRWLAFYYYYFFFFIFRKQLSFCAALHLPAQKRVEEQTLPDFNPSTNASGRPGENRSESSSVHQEW